MKKILCLFDYGMGVMTGYATVSKNIVAQVKKEFGDDLHLDIIAINYFGDPYKEYNDTVQVWPIHITGSRHCGGHYTTY